MRSYIRKLTRAFTCSFGITSMVQAAGPPRYMLAVRPEMAVPVVAVGASGMLNADPLPLPAPEPVPPPRLIAVDDRIAIRTEQLRPEVKQRLVRAAERLPEGVSLIVTSAYRTREEQAALTPTFGVKARPGTSTHEVGRGIDLNTLVDGERISPREQHAVIGEALSAEGFRWLGSSDPVHYSIPAWVLNRRPEEDRSLALPTLDEVLPSTDVDGPLSVE